MQIAAGTFDRQADTLARLPQRTRRVATFTSRPPVPARAVRVTYDSEFRPASWRMDVQAPTFTLASLSDRPLERLGTWRGAPVYRVLSGPLRGVLVHEQGGNFVLLTVGYAQRYEADLRALKLPAQ